MEVGVMGKKQECIAMIMQKGNILVNGEEGQIKFPKGCKGLMLVFESKKAARDYFGKDVGLLEITDDR
jgi:hypothetical protein